MHQKLVRDHGMERVLGPLVIQGSKVPPFSLSILHKIPVNSHIREMDDRHI